MIQKFGSRPTCGYDALVKQYVLISSRELTLWYAVNL